MKLRGVDYSIYKVVKESLSFSPIKFLIFSCAYIKHSLEFFVKILNKQSPLNGRKTTWKKKKKKLNLYFFKTFDTFTGYLLKFSNISQIISLMSNLPKYYGIVHIWQEIWTQKDWK